MLSFNVFWILVAFFLISPFRPGWKYYLFEKLLQVWGLIGINRSFKLGFKNVWEIWFVPNFCIFDNLSLHLASSLGFIKVHDCETLPYINTCLNKRQRCMAFSFARGMHTRKPWSAKCLHSRKCEILYQHWQQLYLPNTCRFLFFALFSIVGKTSAFVGPFVSWVGPYSTGFHWFPSVQPLFKTPAEITTLLSSFFCRWVYWVAYCYTL